MCIRDSFRTPFVNTIQPSDGAAPSDEVTALLSLLEGAVFTQNDLDAILDGDLRPEEAACARAFARLGYRADGKNGARVAALARWLAEGRAPQAWTDAE